MMGGQIVGRIAALSLAIFWGPAIGFAQDTSNNKVDGSKSIPAASACKGPSAQLTSPGFKIQCGRRIPAGVFLGSFLASPTDSMSDCVARCTADARCLAFSLNNPETASRTCTLYASSEGSTDAQDWIAGVRVSGAMDAFWSNNWPTDLNFDWYRQARPKTPTIGMGPFWGSQPSTGNSKTGFDFDWYGQAEPKPPTIALGPAWGSIKPTTGKVKTGLDLWDIDWGDSTFGDYKKQSSKLACGATCSFDSPVITPVIVGADPRPNSLKPFDWKDWTKVTPTPDMKELQLVYFVTDRTLAAGPLQVASFSDTPSMNMTYGHAIVSIPKSHLFGNVERPQFRWWRLIPLGYEAEKDAKHFRIQALNALDRESFVGHLKDDADSVLLFIHGYNVPFSDAIFEAAQIAFDANFGGTVLAFSWPSGGTLAKYEKEVGSAEFAGPHLAQIFNLITEEIGKKSVYVVAHSLGNKVLVDASQQAALSKAKVTISEIVMAAPDVDTYVLRSKLNQFRAIATNITMYASSADKALLASGAIAFGTRAGYVPAAGPNIFPGIEVIDVTAVGDDMLGLNHSNYSRSRVVLDDLARLIRSLTHLPPHVRTPTLKFMPDKANIQYWLYPP